MAYIGLKTTAVVAVSLGLLGCNTDLWLDWQLNKQIGKYNLSGDPAQGRELPSINDPVAQLGKQLFFTKALGGDKDTACVSCHHPMLGGGDDLPLPVGVAAENPDLLGPGRKHDASAYEYDGGPTVPRNAPTVFNIGLWDSKIFHDGRLEALVSIPGQNGAIGGIRTPDTPVGVADPEAGSNLAEAQSRFPVTSPEEMRGFHFELGNSNADVRSHLESRLQAAPGYMNELDENRWLEAFQVAFGQPQADAAALITYQNIAKAIGEYERSMVFTNSRWKRYVQGEKYILSRKAKRGALLFYRSSKQGGAGCVNCHKGDTFTDEQFHVLAMPQVGRGKEENGMDFGRWYVTGKENDRFAFRTPSLLNVSETGPWGHAGAYSSLEDVIRHHANPRRSVNNFDYNTLEADVQHTEMLENTRPALKHLSKLQRKGQSKLPKISLTKKEVNQLAAFLRTLTDPCTKNAGCLEPWVARGEGHDGLLLNAIDENGNPL